MNEASNPMNMPNGIDIFPSVLASVGCILPQRETQTVMTAVAVWGCAVGCLPKTGIGSYLSFIITLLNASDFASTSLLVPHNVNH